MQVDGHNRIAFVLKSRGLQPARPFILSVCFLLLGMTEVSFARDIDPPKKQQTFQSEWDQVDFSHELWDSVLQSHVNDAGRVDYAALQNN